jgi:hypothetical protein
MSTPPHHKSKHHRSKDEAKKSKRAKKQHHSKHRRHEMETDVSEGKLSVIDYGTTQTRKSNSQFEIGSGGIRNTPSCKSSNENGLETPHSVDLLE